MSHPHDPVACPKGTQPESRTSGAESRTSRADSRASGGGAQHKPAWGEGIRALYDAVTQEPLPSDFQNLLNQLAQLPKN